jgi:hypothetical protein
MPAGKISFERHMISDDFASKNAGGVTFSEPHGSACADMTGDGTPDFVIGKRFFSHNESTTDPDPYGAAVLYVYRTVRNKQAPGGAEFVPELVHNQSGAGSQVLAVDLNKDGVMDLGDVGRAGRVRVPRASHVRRSSTFLEAVKELVNVSDCLAIRRQRRSGRGTRRRSLPPSTTSLAQSSTG